MVSLRFGSLVSQFLVMATSVTALVGCGGFGTPSASQALKSSIESVEIPQTEVEDQSKIGFCWAYAMAGLIESDQKFRTGKILQLSEEALGYYRMLEGIYFWTQNLTGQDLTEALASDSFQGWVLKSSELPDTFDLVKKYGVVPESAWSKKFQSSSEVDTLVRSMHRSLNKLIFDTPNPKLITREVIVKKVLLAPGAWSSAPPTEFVVDGISQTPQSYLASLGFNPDGYSSVVTNKPEDLNAVIAATKRALVRGVSVPLGFPVNFDLLKADMFSGEGQDLSNPKLFFKEGGHAVLVDDFVNQGSKEGALPLNVLVTEFLKPAKELDYLVFKNSWGKDAKTNESGKVLNGSKTGYYKIDREYLQGSANMAKLPEYKGMLEVVVPNDIALDPFGSESVNPSVALP